MKPTAAQVAEDIFYAFMSPEDALENDPEEPVFQAKDVIAILSKYGLPLPDFEAMVTKPRKPSKPSRKQKLAFSKKIQDAMDKKKMTYSELARLTGKNKAVISRVLAGQNITFDTILAFQDALKIQLLNLEPDPAPKDIQTKLF